MKHKTLSFRDQVFLACFLVTLVPLLLTSVVMVRLFTASLNRQSEQEANRQIMEIRSRFAALLDDCEEACRELTRNGTVSRYMIDTTTIEMQRGMYVSLYQASQEIYGHAQISVYDVKAAVYHGYTVAGRFSSGVLGYFKESIRTGGHDLVPHRSIPGTE